MKRAGKWIALGVAEMDTKTSDWRDEAYEFILRNLGCDRILSVSPNPAYACISISVLRDDEEYPSKLIQYVPPTKDLVSAAEEIRNRLLRDDN